MPTATVSVATSAYRGKFVGTYAHRVIMGGVGHNLPQEAPGAFAQVIIDVDRMQSSHNRRQQ